MPNQNDEDKRLKKLIDATQRMVDEEYDVAITAGDADLVDQLAESLQELAQNLAMRRLELQQLDQITANINAGVLLDDILDSVYHDFREIIPYNRIGFSLIDPSRETVRARWAKSDQPDMYIRGGYSAELAGSSLQTIIETGRPRIINDLKAYLDQKPLSDSTRLVVKEGMRSSLTCPLIVEGYPIGFMFFSSVEPDTYSEKHIAVFQRIARQLSIIVDKGYLVSEVADRQAQVEDNNDELRRLNELKNTFLGMAAHDLRNPIGNIQMTADLLRNPKLTIPQDQQVELLDDIVGQTQHMLALLNDLLDVTQIEAGKLELKPDSINVGDFLAGAVSRHTPAATAKSITIVLEPVPTGTVRADPTRLRQVIDNLVSNAVKFSPSGTTVIVRGERDKDQWRLSVQDQGPGITAEDRSRLFTDFARLSARPTGGEESTGLGLAITRRIVEAHGGVLDVDSVPGEGATFWLTLPDEPV